MSITISTSTGNYELVWADSRQQIKQVPDHSVDLLLTDPPYNLSRYSTANLTPSWRKPLNNDIASWDYETFVPAAWREDFLRVLIPTGNLLVFTSFNLLGCWHQAFDPVFGSSHGLSQRRDQITSPRRCSLSLKKSCLLRLSEQRYCLF